MKNFFKERLIAYFIDGLIIDFLLSPFIFLLMNQKISGLIYLFVFVLIFVSYFFISENFFSKTIGKKIMNLQVENVNYKNIFKRSFARLIPLEPLSYFINDGKFWHETLSGTSVTKKL